MTMARSRIAALCTALALGCLTAVPAASGAPKPGKIVEKRIRSAAPDAKRVRESLVRVYDPLPQGTGAPPACDWLEYLRFRNRGGPREAKRADAVITMMPGFLGGVQHPPRPRQRARPPRGEPPDPPEALRDSGGGSRRAAGRRHGRLQLPSRLSPLPGLYGRRLRGHVPRRRQRGWSGVEHVPRLQGIWLPGGATPAQTPADRLDPRQRPLAAPPPRLPPDRPGPRRTGRGVPE